MTPQRLQPEASAASEHFWEATKQRRYLVQWCGACTRPIFYPRDVCPYCLGAEHLAWRESKGTGTVHAVSVQHRPANPTMTDRVPYAVALVDVDDGIRVMTNIVNVEPDAVAVGDAVRLTWEELPDGRNLPLFEPATVTKEA